MILLDTCVFLWLASDQSRLSPRASESIRAAGEFVHVSAITAWEIAWKQTQGRLELGLPARAWFDLAITVQHVKETSITSNIALRAASLPRIHNDPADRLIIATAMEFDLPLVTPDTSIAQYPGLKILW